MSLLRGRWAALAIACVALLCALVGALGPAHHLRDAYSWPPRNLPGASPARLWYAPLLLARHEPASVDVRVPCSLPPALPGAGTPTIVVATVRRPTDGGLFITRRRNVIRMAIGGQTLTTVPLSGGACSYALHVAANAWSLSGGSPDVSRGGGLSQMPTVVGLFSELDLRAGITPTVDMTTTVYGTKPSTGQTVFWLLAVLAAIAAVLLALRGPRARRAPRPRIGVGLPDAVVAVVLLVWWVIGPAFFDDGWVLARQRDFSPAGGFSAYYTSFGVNLPLDYWLEWIEHWLAVNVHSLLLLRLPALVCLAVTWLLCRWLFARCVRSASRAAVWALAAAFLTGALAWGMTLRPEPVAAVLATGVLVCTVSFLETESPVALAMAAALVALSLAGHPSGIVSIAPLLAASPVIVRWSRARLSSVMTVVVGTVALLVVLVTVGADASQRRAEISSLRAFGDETAGWRDEQNRYTLLSHAPWGSTLRRASVALILLAVFAYLLRRRRDAEDSLRDLPTVSLGISLLLFFVTPTKWPWHFGTLIGVAAVAVAAETVRLTADRRPSRWELRPFLVVFAAVVAAAWSWNPRLAWGDLDLRTLHWTLGVEHQLTFSKLGGAVPIFILLGFGVFEFVRRSGQLRDAPTRAAAWTAPAIVFPLILFTMGVLVADAVKTHSWTLTRQNVRTLEGRLGCGLADDAVVPVRASMRPLAPLRTAQTTPSASTVPPPPIRALRRFVLGPPTGPDGAARSDWFRVTSGRRLGFFVGGTPSSSDSLALEWGQSASKHWKPFTTTGVSTDFGGDAQPGLVAWRFYPVGMAPSGAQVVRIVLRSAATPSAGVILTGPVTYDDRRLSDVMRNEEPALVLPNLVTYVPCARQPRVAGAVQAPKLMLAFRSTIWPLGTGTSPFDGLPLLYRFIRLPLSDSSDPPGDVAVYDVDRAIPGAAELAAMRSP